MWLMLFTHYLFGYVGKEKKKISNLIVLNNLIVLAGTAVCSIGLVLALCSVYIFTRRHMRSTVSTYLACLSISDSFLLLLCLVLAINASIHPNQQNELFYSSRLHKRLFPYVYPCIIWFQFTSVWITVAFAIDRWFAIKWPMLHYTYSSKRACYIVGAIYCFGLIYSLPRFFEYQTKVQHEKFIGVENFTESVDFLFIENKVLHNPLYHYIVHLILYSIFQSILPFLMLSYFNVELIRSINASSNFLKHFTSLHVQNSRIERETNVSRHREGAITRSVICLIALFTFCQVPASILHYLYVFYRNHPILYVSYDISNFLILFNSAVNFFIFTYFNRRFRRELTRICFHIKKSRGSLLRTPSRLSMRRTNSSIRNVQQNSQLAYITPVNSWESQTRNNHLLQQLCGGRRRESVNELRKKSSDISILSQYQLQPMNTYSESLINLRLNSNRIQRNKSFPSKKHAHRKQKKISYRTDQVNFSITSKCSRRYSDRLSLNNKRNSLIIYNNPQNYRARQLHYVTYRHDQNRSNSMFAHNPLKTCTATTMLK
ncbi:unnamed protein product [Rotaria socialis]|uniref:G-protein coupled receptors family 1 profile domain-containing protein n=1 Tax=Rotaria socialis TaxID=392032 RepID=A0A817RJ20_9BILA|nr:unnamed protein product [Rotaria socialis]